MTAVQPQRCVLLKFGELVLKGRNRHRFEQHLYAHLERVLADHSDSAQPPQILQRSNVAAVLSGPPTDQIVDRVRRIPGLSVVQPGLRTAKTPDAAADAAVLLAHEHRERHGDSTIRFAIRARRRHKRFPLGSAQLASHVGARVAQELGWAVDLNTPDLEIHVEVDHSEVFVSAERLRGEGGLPVGSSGTALVLLSGGFDSPVAAYRAMRRGLRCEFVHFTGAPLTGPSSTYKAYALVRELDWYQGDSQLHVIPIGTAQRALATAGASELQIVAQRRLMIRTAAALAGELGAQALITGDSLGQVSSQTLSNMATIEQATTLPVLRPLVAWDKEEIIDTARHIGTAEISSLPDEDCCSLLTPPHVATRSTSAQLQTVEERADTAEIIEKLLARVQVMSPDRTPSAAAD